MVALLFALLQFQVHPFHVSVSDIKYKEEINAIQISSRIFLDDLELALKAYSGRQDLDIVAEEQWEFVNESLKNYLLDKMALRDEKGRGYDLRYVGAEIEADVMWCYLEIEKVKRLRRVTVTNRMLHEVWADQENLVHFRAFEDVQSARLFRGEDTVHFDWED